MAQIQKGTTYTTGDQVTAANLNALADAAILLPGAITDQTAKTVPLAADTVLIHSAADTALRKSTLTQLFSNATGIPLTTGVTGILPAANGGTGVANASTLTLAGNVTHAGAFTQSFTATANTSLTLPVTGTLATLAGSEALSNKTITASSFSGTTGAFTTLSASGAFLQDFNGAGGNSVNVRFNSSNQRGGIYVNGTSGQPFFGQNLTFSSGSTFNYDKTAGAWAIGDAGGSTSLNFYWAASGTAGTAAMDLSTNTQRVGFYNATGWNLSTGLAVTGALSATGNTTIGSSGSAPGGFGQWVSVRGGSNGAIIVGRTAASNDALEIGWTTTSASLTTYTNVPININVNNATVGAFSSTGLAVTGALSTTGSATIGDATTTTTARLTLDGLGTAGNVPVIRFKSAGVTKAFFGLSGSFLGTSATDALVGTDAAGASIVFHPGDSGVERARIDSSGQLGINTSSPAKTLDVNGTVQFRDATGAGQAFWIANKGSGSTNSGGFGLGYNAVNWTPASLPSALLWDGNSGVFTINTSSRKYKRNIVAVTDEQLDKALMLKPSYYQRKEQEYFEYGFIAEEVNEIGLDEFVTRVDGEISGLAYDKMVALAIGLAQRQAKENANLVAQVAALSQRLAALEA